MFRRVKPTIFSYYLTSQQFIFLVKLVFNVSFRYICISISLMCLWVCEMLLIFCSWCLSMYELMPSCVCVRRNLGTRSNRVINVGQNFIDYGGNAGGERSGHQPSLLCLPTCTLCPSSSSCSPVIFLLPSPYSLENMENAVSAFIKVTITLPCTTYALHRGISNYWID